MAARNFGGPINMNANEVQNAIIQNLAAPPSSPTAGRMYWDTALVALGVYNGTAWNYYQIGNDLYQGAWNASTNSPALTSGTGTKGYRYKVSVAGTTTLDGNSAWNVGDELIFNGSTWDKFLGPNSMGSSGTLRRFDAALGAITGGTAISVTHGLGVVPAGAQVLDTSGNIWEVDTKLTTTTAQFTFAQSYAASSFNVTVFG